jgi:hypothetical protein
MTVDARTPIGRADLVRLLSRGAGEAETAAFVRLCGFEPQEEKEMEALLGARASTGDTRYASLVVESEPEEAELGFWRVKNAEFREEQVATNIPDWFRKATLISREVLRKERPPGERPFPLLTPWSRLWPFLRKLLSQVKPGRTLDSPRLVKQVARCRPIRNLPRRPVLRWAKAIHVLCDRSTAVRTYFNDMDELVVRLRDMCGRHRLKLFVFPFGLTGLGYQAGTENLLNYSAPRQSATVLALSDLGALTADRATEKWALDIGRALTRSGSRATALVPCPPGRWHPRLSQTWRTAYWEMGRPIKLVAYRPRGDQGATTDRSAIGAGSAAAGLDTLLALVSPVVRLDAELIRYIRALLPPGQTDAGMEADIWMERHDYRTKRDAFTEIVPPTLRKKLVDLLFWFHGDSPEIFAEELTIIRSIDPESANSFQNYADEINAGLAASLKDRRWQASGFTEGEFLGYIKRREGRLPDQAYGNDRVAAAWVLSHLAEDGRHLDTDTIPNELPMEKVAWALGPGERKHYRLAQVQQRLATVADGRPEAGPRPSPLGVFSSTTELVFVRSLGGREPAKIRWQLKEPGPQILTSTQTGLGYRIETPEVVLELEQIAKPAWARAIGRDGDGLFVRLADNRRFYWLNPGRYDLSTPESRSPINVDKGCWLLETKYQELLESGFLTPEWEAQLAEDEHGLYEVVFIHGIRQVFRWIPPGEFLMGSPEDEPARDDDEDQHEVELTRGFWLADTACTQALWEAVMGGNPSRFDGADRPVENVSWGDCREFFERANQAVPGLDLWFPTEAQWEYACRAGTATPFWFGNQVTPEQANYNGNYPYARGAKGKYREETVAVGSLPCNGWGLYEMHGNVLEWCSDWFGSYAKGKTVDPRGPSKGGDRAPRGGSWISSAGGCRSASRSGLHPGDRSDVGFRLSRGQAGRAQEQDREKQGAAPRKAQRSGAARARRGSVFGEPIETTKKK